MRATGNTVKSLALSALTLPRPDLDAPPAPAGAEPGKGASALRCAAFVRAWPRAGRDLLECAGRHRGSDADDQRNQPVIAVVLVCAVQ